MEKNLFLLHCFFAFIHIASSANVEYDGSVQIKLYHALNDQAEPVFTERGNISISSLRAGTSISTNNILTTEEKLQLKDLAIKNGLYRIRAVVQNSDNTETYLLSSIKTCMLVESEFQDMLTVSLDHVGNVIGVSISAPGATLCNGQSFPVEKLKKFHSQIYLQHVENGPIPDTAAYIQKLEREREARERGEVKDNRSFLAKYWLYIVPVVVFMLISSAANPEAGGGGSGGAR